MSSRSRAHRRPGGVHEDVRRRPDAGGARRRHPVHRCSCRRSCACWAGNWWAPKPLARLHRRIGISEIDRRPDPRGETAERAASALWKPSMCPFSPSATARPALVLVSSPVDEILDATTDVLREVGHAKVVSIRSVAQRVCVTPPSSDLHFADKDGRCWYAACVLLLRGAGRRNQRARWTSRRRSRCCAHRAGVCPFRDENA